MTGGKAVWSWVAVAATASGLTSCVLADDSSADTVASTQQALTVQRYYWYQDRAAKDMGPAPPTRFCALSSVGGRFLGDDEEVRVTRSLSNGQYVWTLHGSSQQERVEASATCTNVVGR